jgi:hypothetical protein
MLPWHLDAAEPAVPARISTVTIDPAAVTALYLRPEFESVIRMPEEVTSVVLGNPAEFKAEHNEDEPEYVYVKPTTKEPAQSNLLIATKSGQHVTLELISEGPTGARATRPVDFLIEYRTSPDFLVASSQIADGQEPAPNPKPTTPNSTATSSPTPSDSALSAEYDQQVRINAPLWAKSRDKQIETAIGDIRQWNQQTVIAYSLFNPSDRPVEILPPQIQISGRKHKKKRQQGQDVTSNQLQVREYRLSSRRLEPGARADGVVVFDRPNFKQSTERLFLEIALADQVDQPILIGLPFTPPIAEAAVR